MLVGVEAVSADCVCAAGGLVADASHLVAVTGGLDFHSRLLGTVTEK